MILDREGPDVPPAGANSERILEQARPVLVLLGGLGVTPVSARPYHRLTWFATHAIFRWTRLRRRLRISPRS
jgi:hypothetical protein